MDQVGIVEVESHQFLVGERTADPTKIVARGSLIALGMGFVTVFAGIAVGPVSVRVSSSESEPDLPYDGWDVIEEVEIMLSPNTAILSIDGEIFDHFNFSDIPEGGYRMRVCAEGRDSNWDLSVGEATERYLIQIWPGVVGRGEVYSKKNTDDVWNVDVEAELSDLQDLGEDATRSLGLTNRLTNGSSELIPLGGADRKSNQFSRSKFASLFEAKKIAAFDPDLALQVCNLDPRRQRDLAAWSAERAYDIAGLAGLDWVRPALRNMDSESLPNPFDDLSSVFNVVQNDPSISKTNVRQLGGARELICQYVALDAIFLARQPDPLKSALDSLNTAIVAGGERNLKETLLSVRRLSLEEGEG